MLSAPPEATQRLSGLTATVRTSPWWPPMRNDPALSLAARIRSRTRSVLSRLPLTAKRPNGLMARVIVSSAWA